MNTPALERFLATIYVDAEARARFLESPYFEAQRAGLSEEQRRALERIDRTGLEMAARSFSRKRAAKYSEEYLKSRREPSNISRQLSALLIAMRRVIYRLRG